MNAYSKLTLIVGLIAGSTSAKLCHKNKGKKGKRECKKEDLCDWKKGDCVFKKGLLKKIDLQPEEILKG